MKPLLLSLLFSCASSFAGFGSHGGDLCELEFKGLIPSAAAWLNDNQATLKLSVGFKELTDKLAQVKVRCVDTEVSVKGVPKTAVTDLDALTTTINTARWNQGSLIARRAVVLHEGMVLLGVESTDDYHVSEKMFQATANAFQRFFCVTHFSSGAGITDTMVELSHSPRPLTDGEKRIFKPPMYQLRILRGSFDPATEVIQAVETHMVDDHLRCTSSAIEPRLVSCEDFLGPFNGNPASRGMNIFQTSLYTKVRPSEPMFRLDLRAPILGSMPMTTWDLQSLRREQVFGPTQYHAFNDYDYRPNLRTFMYSYCSIR